MNNDFQGMVRQWQDLFYNERYSGTEMKNPDFVKMAEAFGCIAMRCTSEEDLPRMMKEFVDCDEKRPILFEVVVDKREHVYPMVPAGKRLDEMVLLQKN